MMELQTIQTECIDGIWWARLNHSVLGYVDARGATENMAISNFMLRLREACQQFRTARYVQLQQRFPEILKRGAA